jgi:hypothetical protein
MTVPDTEKVFLYWKIDITGGVLTTNYDWRFETTEFVIDVQEKQLFADTPADAWLIHEALATVTESITDAPNVLVSNFFGRIQHLERTGRTVAVLSSLSSMGSRFGSSLARFQQLVSRPCSMP